MSTEGIAAIAAHDETPRSSVIPLQLRVGDYAVLAAERQQRSGHEIFSPAPEAVNLPPSAESSTDCLSSADRLSSGDRLTASRQERRRHLMKSMGADLEVLVCQKLGLNNSTAAKVIPKAAAQGTRWALSEQFRKTKLCPYNKVGSCWKGLKCTFAHDTDQLRSAPDLYKTKLCLSWKSGECTAGVDCQFAHGRAELRSTREVYKSRLCHFWLHGECNKGPRCRHAHGLEELPPQLRLYFERARVAAAQSARLLDVPAPAPDSVKPGSTQATTATFPSQLASFLSSSESPSPPQPVTPPSFPPSDFFAPTPQCAAPFSSAAAGLPPPSLTARPLTLDLPSPSQQQGPYDANTALSPEIPWPFSHAFLGCGSWPDEKGASLESALLWAVERMRLGSMESREHVRRCVTAFGQMEHTDSRLRLPDAATRRSMTTQSPVDASNMMTDQLAQHLLFSLTSSQDRR